MKLTAISPAPGCRQNDPAYSDHLDIGYNHVARSWRDEVSHYHQNCEEYMIVLNGQLDFIASGRQVRVSPGHLIGFRSGTEHQVIGGVAPLETILIRVPGGLDDKVLPAPGDCGAAIPGSNHFDPILLDLRQSFGDYPLGACLPESHPNYSPFLDFRCAWGINSTTAWKHEQLHFHSLRAEYYMILDGSLNFAVETAAIAVNAGQMLIVPPGAPHRVLGGIGPVDIVFIRVPGGRGDKQVV